MYQLSNQDLLSLVLGQHATKRLLQDGLIPIFEVADGLIENAAKEIRTGSDPIDIFDRARNSPFGRVAAAKLLVQRHMAEAMTARTILTSPEMVTDYLRITLGTLPHEVFYVLWLDTQNHLIQSEELFRGTLTQTSVYPREVIKRALEINAAAAIFAHNHPSGSTEPSRADISLTEVLKKGLSMVDIRTLDHFVVVREGICSMAQRGLI